MRQTEEVWEDVGSIPMQLHLTLWVGSHEKTGEKQDVDEAITFSHGNVTEEEEEEEGAGAPPMLDRLLFILRQSSLFL